MAKFMRGDIWQRLGHVDLFCFTANATITKNGALFMGRGMAKQVRHKFSGIDKVFGELLSDPHPNLYGLERISVMTDGNPYQLGAFQVKYHFREKADLDVIRYSCRSLFCYVLTNRCTVALNFPGIGNGRLSRREVMPIIELLPDNVEIWEYE